MHERVDVRHARRGEDAECVPEQRPVERVRQIDRIDRQIPLDQGIGVRAGSRFVPAHEGGDGDKRQADDEDGREMFEDYCGERTHVTVTGVE
jgi:hypothetical protein